MYIQIIFSITQFSSHNIVYLMHDFFVTHKLNKRAKPRHSNQSRSFYRK
jgi:hypothetical protein